MRNTRTHTKRAECQIKYKKNTKTQQSTYCIISLRDILLEVHIASHIYGTSWLISPHPLQKRMSGITGLIRVTAFRKHTHTRVTARAPSTDDWMVTARILVRSTRLMLEAHCFDAPHRRRLRPQLAFFPKQSIIIIAISAH